MRINRISNTAYTRTNINRNQQQNSTPSFKALITIDPSIRQFGEKIIKALNFAIDQTPGTATGIAKRYADNYTFIFTKPGPERDMHLLVECRKLIGQNPLETDGAGTFRASLNHDSDSQSLVHIIRNAADRAYDSDSLRDARAMDNLQASAARINETAEKKLAESNL